MSDRFIEDLREAMRHPVPEAVTHDVDDVIYDWDHLDDGEVTDDKVVVRGAITRVRHQPGQDIILATVVQDGCAINIFLDRDVMPEANFDYAIDLMVIGRKVEFAGKVFKSRTGKVSVGVERLWPPNDLVAGPPSNVLPFPTDGSGIPRRPRCRPCGGPSGCCSRPSISDDEEFAESLDRSIVALQALVDLLEERRSEI